MRCGADPSAARRRRDRALAIERRREIEQADEFALIAIGVAATIRARELCRLLPRCVSLECRLTQQHTELRDRGGKAKVALDLCRAIRDRHRQEAARVA